MSRRRRWQKPCAHYEHADNVPHGIKLGDRVEIYGRQIGTVAHISKRVWVRFDGDGLIFVKFEMDEPYRNHNAELNGQIVVGTFVSLRCLDTSRYFPRKGTFDDDLLAERSLSRRSRAPLVMTQLQAWSEEINNPCRAITRTAS